MKRFETILIAGPTASGKSGLAVELAKRVDGVVVNADSMQVYDVLSQLTARPQEEEMEGIEHRLFGFVSPSRAYSVAQYLGDVAPVLAELRERGKTAIITGGTGLYFKALLEGLSSVPPIDAEIRERLRLRPKEDLPELFRELQGLDREGAVQIEPGDSQRIIRALEVVQSTGKPLSWWHEKEGAKPLIGGQNVGKLVLLPEREVLRARIAERFYVMVESGAFKEVQALLDMDISPELPAMRAIGVSQLAACLEGELKQEEAINLAIVATRQYAKRQTTWFRNQFLKADDGWQFASSPEWAFQAFSTLR